MLLRYVPFAAVICLLWWQNSAVALELGEKAKPFHLERVGGELYDLKKFSKYKVLLVWYQGAQSVSQNRWFQDQLRELYRSQRYRKYAWASVGIVNFDETILPDFIIRMALRREQKRTPAPILMDPDGEAMRNYGFVVGESNLYVFDQHRVLRWKSTGSLSQAQGRQVLELMHGLIEDSG